MSRHPKFSPDHPLWDELVDLRRKGHSAKDLVKVAREKGYSLSFRQIAYGLGQVAPSFGLPHRASLFLLHRYRQDMDLLDAFMVTKLLLAYAIERLKRFDLELATADTEQRKAALEHGIIPDEMTRAYGMAERHERLRLEIVKVLRGEGQVSPQGVPLVGTANVLVLSSEDFRQKIDQLTAIWRRQIGAPTAEEAAVSQFGHDNVREVTDAEVVDPGDDDD